jgi:DNA-nicking Smr family endonuclease
VKRTNDLSGARLWAVVTATVRPLAGRQPVSTATTAALVPVAPAKRDMTSIPSSPRSRSAAPVQRPPEALEPGRMRRLRSERDPVGARIDLHGLTQDAARAALTGFVARAAARGERTILVITGKGALGDGVLRRRVPEWLAEPPIRSMVAGVSEAHRRHGGAGALYVALKRDATR